VLPSVTVELKPGDDPKSAISPIRTTISADDGSFRFDDVRHGRYQLAVSLPGFDRVERTIIVGRESFAPLRIVLEVSALEDRVTVQARAIDAAPSTMLRTDVDRRLIETLPSESLSAGLSSLVALTSPGVASDSNGGFHPLGEHAETSFVIDNQPITDQQSRTFSNQISEHAIQSLDVMTGVPLAEFGDKTSLIVRATTRSGLGADRRSGEATVGFGSFNTRNAAITLGMGSARVGNFLSVDSLASDRFLDTPEIEPLHADGSVYNVFDRVDVRVSPRTMLQLNLGAARSLFESPNTYDQRGAGQDQRQRQDSVNAAPSMTRTLGDRAVLETNAWLRRDRVEYGGSADVFSDQPATLSQRRTLTNAGAKAAVTFTAGAHAMKAGVQQTTTWLTEQFQTGLTDPLFNAPCLTPAGDPSADTSIRDPQRCGDRGLAANDRFTPDLIAHDLTRGGSLFAFAGRARIAQWSAYLQDVWHIGSANVSAGLRWDSYRGMSEARAIQPRIGVTYRLGSSDTIVRASYGRIFLTPYNENLVLASSTGQSGFSGAALGSVGGAPLMPGYRHQYGVGAQTMFGRVRVDGEYFWKRTDGAFDFDVVFNTPLTFPVQFRKSEHDGGLVRLTVPVSHGWQAYATLSHTRALLYGPELGGLRFTADYAPVARPDHDEPLQATVHVEYRHDGRGGFWTGMTWRYDAGLVAVAVPTLSAAFQLTGDQQAAMGLHCGRVFATREQPLRGCGDAIAGATRINIPAPGAEDDAENPPRIAPHQVVDVAAGFDRLKIAGATVRARVMIINLFDTVALYNFLSTFSGTHFVTPRALRATLTIPF